LQGGTYSARQDRSLLDVIFTEGVIDPGGSALLVAERAAGANDTVDVAAGAAIITGDDEANQGKYYVRNTAVVNVAFSPAPGSDERIDLLVLQVNDPTAGGAAGDNAVFEVVTGTVAGTAVAPAVPDTAIPLAEVLRLSTDTTIVNARITDRRPTSTTAEFTVNSRFEVLTTSERDALTPFTGQTIFNSTLSANQFYDGSDWVTFGATFFEALTTTERDAIPAPFTGQTIFNTTTNQIEFWTGTAWSAPSSLGGLSDVDLSGLADQDLLSYDSSSGDWLPLSRSTFATPDDVLGLILALGG
jgi:hypothetical protein